MEPVFIIFLVCSWLLDFVPMVMMKSGELDACTLAVRTQLLASRQNGIDRGAIQGHALC